MLRESSNMPWTQSGAAGRTGDLAANGVIRHPHADLGALERFLVLLRAEAEGGTRRVQLVRRDGRDVSTLYGRGGG